MDLAFYRFDEGARKQATIVVPNPNVKDFLQACFTKAFGALANLEFRYLEGFRNRYANTRLLDRATRRPAHLFTKDGESPGSDRPQLSSKGIWRGEGFSNSLLDTVI
jgi:hypothetical protein